MLANLVVTEFARQWPQELWGLDERSALHTSLAHGHQAAQRGEWGSASQLPCACLSWSNRCLWTLQVLLHAVLLLTSCQGAG